MIMFSPIIVFFHELGHAIPVLLFTNSVVIIRVGNSKKQMICLRGKKINLTLGLNLFYISGSCDTIDKLDKWIDVVSIVFGPLFTLVIFLFTLLLNKICLNSGILVNGVLNGLMNYSLLQLLITCIPITYSFGNLRGFDSDGKQLIKVLLDK